MSTAQGPRIVEVAEQILDDIRRRKLRPGAPYRSTAQTARWLRVSGSTVNRALQLLAQRGTIVRRQRQGTLIADGATNGHTPTLRRVHLVVREDHLRTEGLWAEGVLLGLQGALPGVELQFNFRPSTDEAEYVLQLIHEILSARQAAGLVLIRSTVVTQRLVAASGLPAVVSGTLQPSITGLASVDRDQRQIGVLLAEYLLKERCREFVVLMRERLTAGDHLMLDGALATLAQAGVKLDAIRLRCLPTDAEAIRAAARDLLIESRHRRIGWLCRSEPLARGVDAAAMTLKLRGSHCPPIVVADMARRLSSDAPFPCIEPVIEAAEWGATLGRVLATAARGERPDPEQLVIPVQLWTPTARRRGRSPR